MCFRCREYQLGVGSRDHADWTADLRWRGCSKRKSDGHACWYDSWDWRWATLKKCGKESPKFLKGDLRAGNQGLRSGIKTIERAWTGFIRRCMDKSQEKWLRQAQVPEWKHIWRLVQRWCKTWKGHILLEKWRWIHRFIRKWPFVRKGIPNICVGRKFLWWMVKWRQS